jgi:DNA-binding CsgD family transcriptional regulator/tetratricopeptide (TPR) repeat protein
MIGRDPELAQAHATLEAARETGELLIIVGEAGMGKSTLAGAIVASATGADRRVIEGRATPTEAPIPLAVFRDALRNDRRLRRDSPAQADELAAAFVSHLLPELDAPGRPELDRRDVLFEAATRYLAELSAPGGLVILLEDLHWADPTSLELVLHLARATAHLPVLQIATLRANGEAAGHSLDRLRLDRRRERLGEEIVLGPLDDAAARTLIERVAPDADEQTVDAIRRLAAGNPFFLEELARDASAGRAPARGDLPWNVRQMIIERLERMGPAERDLVHWAAVAGECFDLGLLQAAAGMDDDGFLTAIDRLRKAALIEDDQCCLERMCFRYALTREALLHELLGADRRRRAAGLLRAARALADEGSATVPLERLVGYALDAGDQASAVEYSLAAGRRSFALSGATEAAAHFRRALDLWVPGIGEAARAEALLELGRAIRWEQPEHALVTMGEARALFHTLGDRTSAAVTLATAAGVRRTLGQRDAALADLRTAAAELGADAPVIARLRVADALATALMICGEGEDSEAVAREALALIPDAPSRDEALLAVQLWITAGAVATPNGDADRRALQRGLDLARAIDDPRGVMRACVNLDTLLRWQLARPDEAAAARSEGMRAARQIGARSGEAWVHEAESEAYVERGEFAAAQAALERADTLVSGMPPEYESRLVIDVQRALLDLAAGDPAEAERTLVALWPHVRAVGHYEIGLVTGASIALARLVGGDEDGSVRMLEGELLPMTATSLSERVWTSGLTALGVAAVAARPDLADALPRPETRWSPDTGADLAQAFHELAAGAPPRIGAIEEGAAALERFGFDRQANRIRLLGALALAGVAPGDEAADLARAADDWFARVGAPAWSAAARSVLRRLGRRAPTRAGGGGGDLTARELEVLRLVADGATNRRIAERLVISEPTAARHVANIFLKLRVNSRAEAVRVALGRDLLGHPAST